MSVASGSPAAVTSPSAGAQTAQGASSPALLSPQATTTIGGGTVVERTGTERNTLSIVSPAETGSKRAGTNLGGTGTTGTAIIRIRSGRGRRRGRLGTDSGSGTRESDMDSEAGDDAASNADEGEGGAIGRLVESAGELASGGVEKLTEMVPAAGRALQRPGIIAFVVFLFFLLVDMFLLQEARVVVSTILHERATINNQLVTLSASLTEQLARMMEVQEQNIEMNARSNATDLSKIPNATGANSLGSASAAAPHDPSHVDALRARRDSSIETLQRYLSYPNDISDLTFLIEQHVNYNDLVHRVALEELEWFYTTARGCGDAATRVGTGTGWTCEQQQPPPGEVVESYFTSPSSPDSPAGRRNRAAASVPTAEDVLDDEEDFDFVTSAEILDREDSTVGASFSLLSLLRFKPAAFFLVFVLLVIFFRL